MKSNGDYAAQVSQAIRASIAVKESLLASAGIVAATARVSEILVEALQRGNKLLLCGNGGSAADAQHIAAEFVGRFAFDRPALPALALSVNTSCVTAIGNDYGFDRVFARQIEALARPGDVCIGISTSGNSPNVLCAMAAARQMKLLTVGLTGAAGGKLKDAVEHCICVPSNETPRIQECHILIGHIVSELVERAHSMKRCVFLDRDGVINRKPPRGYVTRWEDLHVLPGTAEAISRLNRAGFLVIVVSNQRCVARGLLTARALEAMHERMRVTLAQAGARIDAVYYCPHEKSGCDCRKPAPGMLLTAAAAYQVDLLVSWMIGDSDIDIAAGRNAGCRTARLICDGGWATERSDLHAHSLREAVDQILALEKVVPANRHRCPGE